MGKRTTTSNVKKKKNQWANEAIKEEIRDYPETNENRNTTFQNLRDSAKAIPRGKFLAILAIQAYIKK